MKYASVKDEGMVRYPMSTEVVCADGYSVDGDPQGNASFVVHCLASGEFEPYEPHTCKPVRCGVAPEMANAAIKKVTDDKGHIQGNEHVLHYHEHVTYECNEGFTTGGELDAPNEYIAECGDDGHFNPPT